MAQLSFDQQLLPTMNLPTGYTLRPLASTDYARGHLQLLSVLTLAPDIGQSAWEEQFKAMVEVKGTYYSIVILDAASDRIVGGGTLLTERKFIRGLGSVGHLEDIVVDKSVQGKGFGKIIIEVLTTLSESLGNYKVCPFP
jgi:glucosamine-phosphate N-acetyltransferase